MIMSRFFTTQKCIVSSWKCYFFSPSAFFFIAAFVGYDCMNKKKYLNDLDSKLKREKSNYSKNKRKQNTSIYFDAKGIARRVYLSWATWAPFGNIASNLLQNKLRHCWTNAINIRWKWSQFACAQNSFSFNLNSIRCSLMTANSINFHSNGIVARIK